MNEPLEWPRIDDRGPARGIGRGSREEPLGVKSGLFRGRAKKTGPEMPQDERSRTGQG